MSISFIGMMLKLFAKSLSEPKWSSRLEQRWVRAIISPIGDVILKSTPKSSGFKSNFSTHAFTMKECEAPISNKIITGMPNN